VRTSKKLEHLEDRGIKQSVPTLLRNTKKFTNNPN